MFGKIKNMFKTKEEPQTFNREEVQYQRNIKGQELEKQGNVNEAMELYWLNVNEEFDGNFPYDRLATLYRKQKDYTKEIEVLEKAIYVFENKVYKERGDRLPKIEKFKERLEKAKTLV